MRTERRYRELMQKFPDLSMTREALLKETIARDTADATRAISPLKQASDAVLIDTSSLSVKQVIEKILQIGFKTKRPKMHLFYRVIYTLARAYFRLFYRLKVEGLHHFRPGSALIAANHSSFFDPPVLAVACPEEVHFFAKTTLFKIPFLSTLIKALNAHPVSSLRQGRRWLLDGEKIILFPEGTRSEGGQLLPLQEGVALLASKAKCRMIPAYIQGTSEVWPLSRTFPRFRGQISVYFGPAIEWDPSLDSAKMTAKLKQAILSLRPDKM